MDKMKLPATTIVETITAALLVMVSLGIGMMIYLNVLTTERLTAKIRAQTVLSRMAEEAVFNQLFITEEVEEDGIMIEKTVSPYDATFPDAQLITLTAYMGSKKDTLCQQKSIVYPTAPR